MRRPAAGISSSRSGRRVADAPAAGPRPRSPPERGLLWQCADCRYQVSVTAGTVLHRTRTPLHLGFWAAHLMTTATPGIPGSKLQRQLGLGRYETAWIMLHKPQRAMVAPERTPLEVRWNSS